MSRPLRILVDLVHAYENNPDDYRHRKFQYEYYNAYSAFRLFRHLGQNGYSHACHRHGPLTPALLAGFDLLFINLMHEHSPAFTADEIRAVHAWIDQGGGLLVIGEHTNAYLSADLINPLLTPLGLTLQKTSALESDPHYATMPPGWILVRHFDTGHPVCEEVTTVHLMAAGHVRAHASPLLDASGQPPRSRGIAFTSHSSWADTAGTQAPAYFGDGVRSAWDEQGSQPVCAVSEFGRGRVLVIGDQNCWGDAWLGVRHNFRLALNAVEWLCPPLEKPPTPLRHTRPHGLVVGIDTRFRPWSIAKEFGDDYFAFFNNWNRDPEVTALAVALGECTLATHAAGHDGDDDRTGELDVLVLPSPTEPVPQAEVQRIQAFSAQGKTVVLLLDVADLSGHAVELLHLLAPGFALEFAGKHVVLGSLAPHGRRQLPGDLRRAGTHAAPLPGQARLLSSDEALCTRHIDLHGYALARVRSSWGAGLIQVRLDAQADATPRLVDAAAPNDSVDIARVGEMEGIPTPGRFVVFLQDGFFRNSFLNVVIDHLPSRQGQEAVRLQYAFMDWLKARRRPGP